MTYIGVAAREGNTNFLKAAISQFDADPLEIKDLDLTGRQLREFPDLPWSKLENLRTIDISGNNIDVVPVPLIHLPQLEKVVRKIKFSVIISKVSTFLIIIFYI